MNCCLSTRIKLNTNIIFFKIPMKIDKNTANAYACNENTGNNTLHIVQELHIFYQYSMEFYLMELHLKSHYRAFNFHQYFHYILQVTD